MDNSARTTTLDSGVLTTPTPFAQSNTSLLRECELPKGVSMKHYTNAHEHVFYEQEKVHTFSMYLDGGFQTYRTDKQSDRGAPGRFCLMPAGSYSAWNVGVDQKFLHVYFSDSYIKRLALENFDVDPRQVSLPQLSFEQSEVLLTLIRHSVLHCNWSLSENRMLLQHNVQIVLLNLLHTVGVKKISSRSAPRAGLSPFARRQVENYVQDYVCRRIVLAELATIAGVSEYHFSRMFKVSFAETPQNYISRKKVEKLQQTLRKNTGINRIPMAQLALEFGFCSQSHMGRVFKQYTGISPGQFVRLNQ